MSRRLINTIVMDFKVQWRNKLYLIGVVVSLMSAVALALVAGPTHVARVVPSLLLVILGGSTLLYVAGLILFEKGEGTLHATVVSPLTVGEYLGAKVVTLALLGTLESAILVGGMTLGVGAKHGEWVVPHLPVLLCGMVLLGAFYTLLGVVLVVRYEKITDFLMPMACVAMVLQVPFLHFSGLVSHGAFLWVPTSAPTMLILGAYEPLNVTQWLYATVGSLVLVGVMAYWAKRAFHTHIIMKLG